jgi:hypothetical protein
MNQRVTSHALYVRVPLTRVPVGLVLREAEIMHHLLNYSLPSIGSTLALE